MVTKTYCDRCRLEIPSGGKDIGVKEDDKTFHFNEYCRRCYKKVLKDIMEIFDGKE